jgi:hypothetical protein
MAYLRLNDYYQLRIQKAQLDQITQGSDIVRVSSELESLAEMISFLVQKYDIEDEFKDIKNYSYGQTYNANDLVELDATLYVATNTYTLNSKTLYNSNVYVCTTAIVTPEAFNSTRWKLVGKQYDLFNVASPYTRYSFKTTYVLGDYVIYKNKIYKCLVTNTNVMPTDANQGSLYWGSGVNYSVTGVEPYNVVSDFTAWNNATIYSIGNKVSYNNFIYYANSNNLNVAPGNINHWLPITWKNSDNRSIQLVAFLIDIVLFKIHMRIAPNNIPQLRKDNYTYAKEWLMEAGGQNNAITANIPLLQPKKGGRIRHGSNVKNINTY